MKVAVGIPAFNEERTIAKVVVGAMLHADSVLVVDDGSKDDTGLIAKALGAIVLKHPKNLGKGSALRDCFKWAKRTGADALITLDGDGQHAPSQIPLLVKTLRESGAEVVIGSRTRRPDDMPRYRWLGGRALDRATQVRIGDRVVDAQSGFRAYSRKAIEGLIAAEFGMSVDSELIMRAHRSGMRIVEVPVTVGYTGLQGSSNSPIMHGLDVLFTVVKFVSIRHPLLFYGGSAAVALTVSVIFGAMTLDYYQRFGRVITNLALVSVATGIIGLLALFTGIILFTLITVVREK